MNTNQKTEIMSSEPSEERMDVVEILPSFLLDEDESYQQGYEQEEV